MDEGDKYGLHMSMTLSYYPVLTEYRNRLIRRAQDMLKDVTTSPWYK